MTVSKIFQPRDRGADLKRVQEALLRVVPVDAKAVAPEANLNRNDTLLDPKSPRDFGDIIDEINKEFGIEMPKGDEMTLDSQRILKVKDLVDLVSDFQDKAQVFEVIKSVLREAMALDDDFEISSATHLKDLGPDCNGDCLDLVYRFERAFDLKIKLEAQRRLGNKMKVEFIGDNTVGNLYIYFCSRLGLL